MISLSLAALISAQAAPAVPAAPAAPTPVSTGRSLRDLPGLTLTYHDLAERDVKAITKALKNKKPLTAAQQQLLSASTSWNVAPTFTKRTKGTSCTITKVNVAFTAKADLPRFNSGWIKPADLPAWQAFLSQMEAQAAAKLWFPYERLANFDQAMVGKPCDEAIRNGGATLDKIKAEAAAFQPAAPVAATPAAAPAQ